MDNDSDYNYAEAQPPRTLDRHASQTRRRRKFSAVLGCGVLLAVLSSIALVQKPDAQEPTQHAAAPSTRDTSHSEAFRRICQVSYEVSSLPFSSGASWPTLDEFLSIDVSEPPFVMSDPEAAASSFKQQEKAVLLGWVTAYERLLGEDDSSVDGADGYQYWPSGDGGMRRTANAMVAAATTLQDADARAMYLYELLPKMTEAGNAAIARRRGTSSSVGKETERARKEAMMLWLRDACRARRMWEGVGRT